MTPVVTEPMLGYHPCSTGFLTCGRNPAGGQCLVGSLTGAVASERVSEALKGSLRMVGNHSKSAKAEGRDRKSTRLNSSHPNPSRMPSSA